MADILKSVYCSDKIEDRDLHYHDYNQILFVTEGSVELIIAGRQYLLTGGNLAFISRYERHTVRVRSSRYKRYILKFSPDLCQEEFALLINRPAGFQHVVSVGKHLFDVEHIIRRLMQEQAEPQPDSGEMQTLLLRELMILAGRSLEGPDYRKDEFDLVIQVQRVLEQDCCQSYSLEELAGMFSVSLSTLSHQFKKVTGYSVFEYLTDRRLALARSRLTGTEDSISKIAVDCGFGFSSNFSKIFRAHSGMTPSQYRKALRDTEK